MTTYLNAVEMAYQGYFLSSCPMDDEGCPLDPTFFRRHPALKEVYVLHCRYVWDSTQTDLVSPFDVDRCADEAEYFDDDAPF